MRHASQTFWEVEPDIDCLVVITKDGVEYRGREARKLLESDKITKPDSVCSDTGNYSDLTNAELAGCFVFVGLVVVCSLFCAFYVINRLVLNGH